MIGLEINLKKNKYIEKMNGKMIFNHSSHPHNHFTDLTFLLVHHLIIIFVSFNSQLERTNKEFDFKKFSK